MLKYFQDPNNSDITSLVDLITKLHGYVDKYIDPKMTGLNGKIEGSYYDYLANCKLSYESKEPDKVIEEISELYKGAIRWHHPGTMININPPANIPAIAASAYSMLFNPNFAQDMSTGALIMSELETNKYLAELAGWDWTNSHGIFTFGGKSTNMHAVKIGLQKCSKETAKQGVKKIFLSFLQNRDIPAMLKFAIGWA